MLVDYDMGDNGYLPGGGAALKELRDKLHNARSDEERKRIADEFVIQYGAPGQVRELLSGFALDQLNYIGLIPAKVLKPLALIAHADELKAGKTLAEVSRMARAIDSADDVRLVELAAKYRMQILRDTIKDVDTLRTWEKMLAGEAIMNVLEGKDSSPKHWWEVWKLTPESKARELVTDFEHNIQAVAGGALKMDSEADVLKYVDTLERARTANLAAGDGIDPVSKFMGTLEGQVHQKVLNYGNDADGRSIPIKALDNWKAAAGDRGFINAAAKALKADPFTMMGDMLRGNAEAWLNRMKKAGMDVPEKYTANYLRDVSEQFIKKGQPFTPQQFKGMVDGQLLEAAAKFGVDYWKIKPGGFAERLSTAVKAAQGMLLLGFNPGYLVNNFLNNNAMMMIEGVWGMRGVADVFDRMAKHGLSPSKMAEAGLTSEVNTTKAAMDGKLMGEIARLLESDPITQAKYKDDAVGRFTRWANAANGWAPITKAARFVEKLSSANAYYNGYMQMWMRSWRRGIGFDKMSQMLEASLRSIDPRLPEHIYAAAEAGVMPDDIAAKVLEAAPVRRTREFVGGVADRVFGGDVDRATALMNEFTIEGKPIEEVFDEKIAKYGYTPEGVARAKAEIQMAAENDIAKQYAHAIKTEIEGFVENIAGMNELGLVDAGSLMEKLDDLRWNELETQRHYKEIVHEVWQKHNMGGDMPDWARELDDAGRRLYSGGYFLEREAVMRALATSFEKAGMPLHADFLTVVKSQHALAESFFATKRKIYGEFFDLPQSERTPERWQAVKAQATKLYNDLDAKMDAYTRKHDAYLAAVYESRFAGSGDLVAKWRKLVADHAAEYRQAVKAQWERVDDLPTATERSKAWIEFDDLWHDKQKACYAEEVLARRAAF